jgi:hypothetical protein
MPPSSRGWMPLVPDPVAGLEPGDRGLGHAGLADQLGLAPRLASRKPADGGAELAGQPGRLLSAGRAGLAQPTPAQLLPRAPVSHRCLHLSLLGVQRVLPARSPAGIDGGPHAWILAVTEPGTADGGS